MNKPQSQIDASQGPTTSLKQVLLLIVFGLMVTVVTIAMIEGVLGRLGVAESERFKDPYVGFEDGPTLFDLQDGEGGKRYVTRPEKLEFFNHQQFPAEKAPDTFRIFTLGGSTTAGRPYDDQVSFSRWLERYLDAAEPSRRHEVINAGAISYASYRIVVLMKELVRYEPDLFVVLTGHNEFLEERTYRDLTAQPKIFKWLRPRLSRLRLSHLVWKALESEAESDVDNLPDAVKTRLDVWTGLAAYERDDALRSSIVEHFAFNLQQMVAIARAHGVKLIFVKPASNLKDFSPFKSDHSGSLSYGEKAQFRERLAEGRQRLASGELTNALTSLEAARSIDPEYAELHFRVGQVHLQTGAFEQAHDAFLRAKELDVAPLRSLQSLVDWVGNVAAQEDVPCIELPALLESQNQQELGHKILGNEIFLDHVHPDIATHSLIAEQLLVELAKDELASLDPSWTRQAQKAIYEQAVGELDRDYYARRDLNLAKVLGWAGKLEEAEPALRRASQSLDGDPDLHLNLGILWQKTDRLQPAAEQLERAVALSPESAVARFNLGVVYGRLGRIEEGIAELEAATRLHTNYPQAFYNLSVLHRRAGNVETAITTARRALELDPDAAEAYTALGLALRLGGRFDEARSALAQSLDLTPDSASTRTDLAVTYAMEKRFDEAEAELNRVLSNTPDFAEAHYSLGRLRAQQGRPEDAAIAYRRTLELAPNHAFALNNLGLLYARSGDLKAAQEHLSRAVDSEPSYAEAFLNLGVVYDMSARPDLALQAVQRAAELSPDDAKTQLALAMLYRANGRSAEALPHFEAARRGGEAIPPEIARRLP